MATALPAVSIPKGEPSLSQLLACTIVLRSRSLTEVGCGEMMPYFDSSMSLFMSDATKCIPWCVSNHSMHPKHENHFDNALVASPLSALLHACNHVNK